MTLKTEMHNSELKAEKQLFEDRKSGYLRNHQSMEARLTVN